MTNIANLSWPEDDGYAVKPPLGTPQEQAYVVALAELSLVGSRRSRYGALPGRDPAVCAQLNADITAAQVKCDAARAAVSAQPKVGTLPAKAP